MSNLHNELRYAPQITLALRRMFGGDHELAIERLSETLTPIVNPWEHPYCAYLRGELLWSAGRLQAATAAEYTFAAIANPANSGLLVVVEGGYARADGATNVQTGITTEAVISATAAGSAQVYANDSRAPRGRTLVYSGTDPVLLGAQLELGYNGGGDVWDMRGVPVILTPGQAYYVFWDTANLGGRWTFWGTERAAYPGELRP